MSTKPLFLLRKAKKSSGEPDVVLWASNDFESTCATLDYLIVKSSKKLSSYFKAVATNFPVVNDLPAEGEIDFTWSERYQLSKDSMTWELKPGAAPDNAHYQGNMCGRNDLKIACTVKLLSVIITSAPQCIAMWQTWTNFSGSSSTKMLAITGWQSWKPRRNSWNLVDRNIAGRYDR